MGKDIKRPNGNPENFSLGRLLRSRERFLHISYIPGTKQVVGNTYLKPATIAKRKKLEALKMLNSKRKQREQNSASIEGEVL